MHERCYPATEFWLLWRVLLRAHQFSELSRVLQILDPLGCEFVFNRIHLTCCIGDYNDPRIAAAYGTKTLYLLYGQSGLQVKNLYLHARVFSAKAAYRPAREKSAGT